MKYKNQPMKEYNIASIAGDGIGKEVVPEGLKVLKDVAEKHQFKIKETIFSDAVSVDARYQMTRYHVPLPLVSCM